MTEHPKEIRTPFSWHDGDMPEEILVVEDDDGIRTTLALALRDEGYAVHPVADAAEGLRVLGTEDIDAMIVDLMLGGVDGYTFIRRARMVSDRPILVVSALSDTDDIVTAFEDGADDYVTKPFQIQEVTARLRALRRRSAASTPNVADEDDDVVLDRARRLVLHSGAGSVRFDDAPLHLTTTEFRLLEVLAASSGRVLSRQSLLERVWDRDYFGDERIVDVHVRRLRTKVEVDPANPLLIVTVRGLGYRLDLQ